MNSQTYDLKLASLKRDLEEMITKGIITDPIQIKKDVMSCVDTAWENANQTKELKKFKA
jgi:hypothetical protein